MTKKTKRKRGGATLACPSCGEPTRVSRTRRRADGSVYRDRVCTSKPCLRRVHTYERPGESPAPAS